MKKKLISVLCTAVLAAGLLTACAGSTTTAGSADTAAAEADTAAAELKPDDTAAAESAQPAVESKGVIKAAATSVPHAEILEAAKTLLAAEGWDLLVTEFTDYVQPNEVVESGDMDVNYFQHITYMNSYNEEKGTHLVNAGDIHYEPLGIYPGKQSDLSAIAEGAEIAVPNDTTNEARALLLLQEQGWLTLNEDAGITATVNDIKDNPYKIKFVELAAEQIPRSRQDFDFAVINGNYALEAGLNVSTDALAVETSDSDAVKKYVNVIAVKEGNENNEGVRALVEVLKSDEIRTFINDKYLGSVVAFEG